MSQKQIYIPVETKKEVPQISKRYFSEYGFSVFMNGHFLNEIPPQYWLKPIPLTIKSLCEHSPEFKEELEEYVKDLKTFFENQINEVRKSPM